MWHCLPFGGRVVVRPECYQCAQCGASWSTYYPRLVCACGCNVLRRDLDALTVEWARADVVSLDDIADADLVEHARPMPPASWSPYPTGNGTAGDNTW